MEMTHRKGYTMERKKKAPRHLGPQLKAVIRRQPTVFAVYTVLRLIVLATLVSSIIRGEYESAFICLLVLGLFVLPFLSSRTSALSCRPRWRSSYCCLFSHRRYWVS